ncbi:MAG: methionine--tRNA ligase subunit beta [Bacteroidetes bacterium]|nr:methionine--tRNA ligase subunit beta [Bacteroidota bacterium]
MIELARVGNKYLADTEPWKLIKTDEEGVKKIMYVAIQCVGALTTLMQPFLPFASKKMENMLGLNTTKWIEKDDLEWVKPGTILKEGAMLFSKIEDSLVQAQIEKLEATKVKEVAYNPVKSEINFDDFSKLDIRTGTIIEAEKVAKANKLLKLKVDLGFEQRTIVSGIAEFFEPDKIIGQKVSVVVNLAPRALRGIESAGMILMAEDAEGKLGFVNTDITGNGLVIR